MKFVSLCSGIEAASVAWEPLGWTPEWYSEIDPHACSVLGARFPHVENRGDMTKLKGGTDGPVDLVVGGTPCQSFSVAGLRKGLDDDRGNLAFEFLRLVGEIRPRWVVWENVPGVLSSLSHDAPDARPPDINLDGDDGPGDGREVVVVDRYQADENHAFGCFMAGLSELGYGAAWRILDAQWVRVQSHPRAVPQRRRRVFAVGYLGDWRRAAAVLLEREVLQGHPTPRREAGQDVAGTLSSRSTAGGGLGTDLECSGGLVAPPLTANASGHYGDQVAREGLLVAMQGNASNPIIAEDGEAPTLDTKAAKVAVAFQSKAGASQSMNPGDVAPALDVGKGDGMAVAIHETAARRGSTAKGLGIQTDGSAYTLDTSTPQAVSLRGRDGGTVPELSGNVSPALRASQGGSDKQHVLTSTVRRITPLEAERLQGFPDCHTAVPHRGKPMADGPRYRLLGNSMAVNVMRWIGERIAMADEL